MLRYLLVFTALLLPLSASAHPGHESAGFISSLLHPLTGVDHLLFLLAVGFWASFQQKSMAVLSSAGFVVAFVVGELVAAATMLAAVWLETSLAMSLIAMSGILFLLMNIPLRLQLLSIALLAACHGMAHGLELSFSVSSVFATMLSSSVVIAAGYLFGKQYRVLYPLFSVLLSGAGIMYLFS